MIARKSESKQASQSETKEPQALTVEELADRWKVSRNTIGRMIHAGQLKAFQVGVTNSRKPRFRIPASEVERHEAGDAAGGFNESKVAQLPTTTVRSARKPSRKLPEVEEFFK